MEENIKKPRRFLKMLGKVGEIIAQEAILKILRGVVNRIGGKKNLPSILFLFLSISLFAQYPATGNKQRLGYQTTGDGLVWRGRASDTVSLKSSTINNAYIIIDTVNNVMYNYIKTKGGWLFNNADTVIINNNFTQPVDSLFFKTSVSPNNVDTAKMRWDYELGTVVLGMYDKVPNEIGFKNFWLVKNQTGSDITKGSLVYASGTVGSSGRISVSKFIANGTIDPIYLLGITAHDLTDGEDGYVISYGKIRQVNTDTFAAGAILYPSPTTAGVWTDVEPVAPDIDLPIGFCVNSSSNNGTIAIRVASGFSLSELHDVAISSPSVNASLYYSGGLWRDTTSALLVSDTASMLTNYLRTGTAASTYLPLTGGTLTGALDINTNNGQNNFQDSTLKVTYNQSSLGVNQNVTGIYSSVNTTGYTSTGILSEASTIYSTAIGVKGKATQSDINGPGVAYGIVGEIAASGSGSNGSTYAGYFNNTSTVGGNNYGLYVNTASGGDYGIYQTGTGVNYFGSNSIFGGNIGIGNNNPIIALDILKSTSSTSAKIRLSTDFASAVRTLELGSGDGLSWDLPGQTSQSPFIKVIGGDQTVGGGGLNLMTNNTSRLFIRQDGTIGIGTITPNATFEVHGSSVFNEGSTDSDFRVESDGNANMVFVDASTDRVGIGTNTPSKTLDVIGDANISGNLTEGGNNVMTNLDTVSLSNRINGKVGLTGDDIISGTKTFNNLVNLTSNLILSGSYSQTNKLLGKNSSDGVGNITVGSGLNLTSDILTATNPTEKYYFNLGIVAGAADNSNATYDFTYGSNAFIVPTSLNGYCIDSVYIRAIGCSTCPPVAGEKDYYVGVYKATSGNRVTTSGATLVGSQITMNEYDLNQVNRNDTLSTGDVWWVYLNGNYVSDLAYITAGFIVKKTCD